MSAGMVGVIEAHSIAGMSAGTHLACRCNKTWVPFPEYHAHLAQELTKAGYGNVMHAQVTALRAAANDAYGRTDLGRGGPSGASVATFLKTRAHLLEASA